jgi:hypothetical protein
MQNKKSKTWVGPSKSEQYLNSKSDVPQVSALMAKSVSEERRTIMASEVENGLYRDGSSNPSAATKDYASTENGRVVSSIGHKKYGQAVSSGGGGFTGGTGDTVKQTPEVYSPLWLNSNLNLPRDRATINAWCRSFYALNPFVHNAINLHATYPISKLSIKCPNKEIEKFFNDMIEEIDLMNICVQIAQEYWLLGESFVYAELDESKGKWSRLLIQNPDYMVVQRTVVDDEPTIMLRPDENLKKIVFSNKPKDIEQRKQLNSHIIESVKRGGNIQIPSMNISHLANKISPYEARGTGLPVCIFKQLMLMDKLRECHSEDTEVLTDKGFKKISEIVYKTSNIELNPNYVNGVELDENGKISSILTMKEDFKVACFNSETEEVEYHKPLELHMSYYNGDMVHFIGKKVDCLVSPNHKMWVDEKINNKWSGYHKKTAIELLNGEKRSFKFLSEANFKNNTKRPKTVKICGKKIPTELYMKVLGYMVSEGCVYENFTKGETTDKNRYDAFITVNQFTESDCFEDMKESFNKFAELLDKNCRTSIKQVDAGYGDTTTGIIKNRWRADISGKDLTSFFKNEIGSNGITESHFKKLPRWVFDLNKNLMSILLDAMVKGDGTETFSKYGTGSKGFKYFTVSKQLADDVYELAYKLGFVPNLSIIDKFGENNRKIKEYIVSWSDTVYGRRPNITNCPKIGNDGGGARVNKVNYSGVVWCFEVPTGLFITRRNGKISVQGNSKFAQADNMVNPLTLIKIGGEGADALHPTFADLEAWREVFESAQYDKDFKVFTHAGVTVEKVGSGAGIYDISGDIAQLIKEIYVGLQVPQVIMDGGADTSYANGGVALDVLRQRYMGFRNKLSLWLRRKIFAPISKIQGFYDYSNGQKQLIIPEIDWNHMSLFDAGDYIANMVSLTQGEDAAKRASLHTLYRSMGLEFEDEIRKMRKEAIQIAISKKEKMALDTMDLNSLRALGEDDEIPEPKTGAVTGGAGDGGAPPSLPGESGSPGGGMPDLSMPPPPLPGGPK